MTTKRRLRVAVAGLGYWGPNIARNLAALPDVELAWCCDPSEASRARHAAAFPGARFTADLADVLADDTVDAVALATPVPLHARMAIEVLRAGKHCFVEKPLAQSVADAEAVVEAARSAGRVLMVGHLLEYHPGVIKLKQLIDDGELGRVLYIYGNRLNLGKLRTDENALWSLGAHDVSVLLRLAGEEPFELEARGESYMREGVEDVVFCFLRFPSGLSAHLHLSWLDPHKERRFTVVGDARMATFDDMALEGKITVYDKGFDEQANSYGEYITRSGDIWSPRLLQRRAAADRDRALRRLGARGHAAEVRRRGRAARRAGAGGAAAVAGRHAPRRPRAHRRAHAALMPRRLSVVVVTHNSRAAVAAALPALCGQLAAGDELVVVDNASADGTLDAVREIAPGATVVETGRNAGFAAAANAGARAASGDLLVFLNPDATPAPGFVDAIRARSRMGRVDGARDRRGRARRQHERRRPALHRHRVGRRGRCPGPGSAHGPREVAFLSGACLAVPRAALRAASAASPTPTSCTTRTSTCRCACAWPGDGSASSRRGRRPRLRVRQGRRRSGGCWSATAGPRSCAATRGACWSCWPPRCWPPSSPCSRWRRPAAGCRRSSPPRPTRCARCRACCASGAPCRRRARSRAASSPPG